MANKMSLPAKKELLSRMRERYQSAQWQEKRSILDGLIAATGSQRKYPIFLLNHQPVDNVIQSKRRENRYNEGVKQALITLWYSANQICSKRPVPFCLI